MLILSCPEAQLFVRDELDVEDFSETSVDKFLELVGVVTSLSTLSNTFWKSTKTVYNGICHLGTA